MLRNIRLNKYLEVNLHCVSIQKNEIHKENIFFSLRKTIKLF